MRDATGRRITGLRISVTRRCNLDCEYCHVEGDYGGGGEIGVDRIREIVSFAASLGVSSVKITGGEPLIREDIVDVVDAVSGCDGIRDVSLTTNGLLLPGLAMPLRDAGLNRVNIACDSVSSAPLLKNSKTISPAISSAKAAGLSPIKLNMVVLKGVNDHEIGDMIRFAGENHVILQLIELVPNRDTEYFKRHYFDLSRVEKELESSASLVVERGMHGRRQFYLPGAVVEVVRPHNEGFCSRCTRLRVTCDGRLKPCLRTESSYSTVHGIESAFRRALRDRRVYCDANG